MIQVYRRHGEAQGPERGLAISFKGYVLRAQKQKASEDPTRFSLTLTHNSHMEGHSTIFGRPVV